MNKNICLIGNPNCGKTTLFNRLTGTYQKVGNWAGVTTEKKQGAYFKDKEIKITDLPGLYSLTPRSDDERAVLKYLKSEKPDCIINVLDGTNLARNLYLTCMLSSVKIPVIIAVNFFDDLQKNGIVLKIENLEKLFGVPVVPISALKGTNVERLIECAKRAEKVLISPETDYYSFIDRNINNIISTKKTKAERFTEKADKFFMNKYLGFPIFFLVIATVYFLSIRVGGIVSRWLESFFEVFAENTCLSLSNIGAKEWIISLIVEAIIGGFGTVMSFLPQILVLFFLLTIIEESGYASRIAFITDKIFAKIGLSGKSFIPMMLCSGCTVTGLMATRTIESSSQKRMTVFLSPFVPCGAKTAVFGWFSGILFNGSVLIATSMYFMGIFAVVVFGNLLKKLKIFKEDGNLFILEMPTLRPPSLKNVFYVLWEKVRDFTVKTGTVIFAVSVVLWVLQNLGFSGYTYGKVEKSFLYGLGNSLKFIFYPLGFGNWQATVSVLSGIMAKEAVIESLTYLSTDIPSLFYNGFSAYAFMSFILLSPPCFASIVTASKELNSKKYTAVMLLFQTVTAYLVALIINLTGILIDLCGGLIFFIIFAIIIITTIFVLVKNVKTCKTCSRCKRKIVCQQSSKHNTTI